MPLSDHEQRMLDEIESALYAEDPKFASSVRGGALRAPTMRRRIQGAALFVIGLAMLVSGVAFATLRPTGGSEAATRSTRSKSPFSDKSLTVR